MIPSIPSLVSIITRSVLTVSRSSTHASNPMPLMTTASAVCILWTSPNDGSQSCGSMPPGTRTDTSATSPATALAISYTG